MASGTAGVAQEEHTFDAEAILQEIEKNFSNPDNLIELFRVLEEACMERGLAVLRADTAPFLALMIRVMKLHPQEAILQTSVLAILVKYIQGSTANKDLFMKEGGVEALATIMNKNRDSRVVQIHAIQIMHKTEDDMLALPRRVTRSVSKAVLASMAKASKHFEEDVCRFVLEKGMQTLARLHSEMDESLVERSISMIVRSMRAHANEACS